MSEHPPVFVVATARTGGTLLTTMLDAHPLLGMSYEIYQDLLIAQDGDPLSVTSALTLLDHARCDDQVKWLRGITDRNLRAFAARARRGGLAVEDVRAALAEHGRRGRTLDEVEDRLDLIDDLMLATMHVKDAQRWGGKIARVDLALVHRRHPDAVFLATLRDGRDVLASRQRVGRFDGTPETVATEWKRAVTRFRDLIASAGARGAEIRYERLVSSPAQVLSELTSLIGIAYHRQMLDFATLDLSLYAAPHGHLSGQQIKEGLTRSSVGRWRSELSDEEITRFEATAGDMLERSGYPLRRHTVDQA